MPQETFYNLKEEKRERVVQALIREYIRVPLEEVSVKNIVTDAGIPRGSFYQYFADKEDALLYLIRETRNEGQSALAAAELEGKDLFEFLLVLFDREARSLVEEGQSVRVELLNQIAKSSRGMILFNEDLTGAAVGNPLFRKFWNASGMEGFSREKKEAVMEMLISALRGSLLILLQDGGKELTARKKLELKLSIIRKGVGVDLV